MTKIRYCSRCHLPVHKGDCLSIDERTSDWVCRKCGLPYLSDEQKKETRISTYHKGTCGMCGKKKLVTGIRNYNYLQHPDYWESRKNMKKRSKEMRLYSKLMRE